MLNDLSLQQYYRSDRDDILRDFYIPCLENSSRYSRAVGFFTSGSLAVAASALDRFADGRGYVRLVASPVLADEDIRAIHNGYETRAQIVEKALIRAIEQPQSEELRQRLGVLAWLIAIEAMDVRIAVCNSLDEYGIYHEKVGIFSDEEGNQVVFTGSPNESRGGLVRNFESFDVFRSWVSEDVARIIPRVEDFERLWDDETRRVKVVEFSDAAKRELLKYKPEQEPKVWRVRERPAGAGGPSLPTSVQLRDYQKEAINAWLGNSGQGILAMATGTGKTFTALSAVTRLYSGLSKRGRSLAVFVICPYRQLVTQWSKESSKFGFDPIVCMEAFQEWSQPLREQMFALKTGNAECLFAVATVGTFRTKGFQKVLGDAPEPVLFIGDEVHNLGATKTSRMLPKRARFRLGLSATWERHLDSEGTRRLSDYFGGEVFEFKLDEAIRRGYLSEYRYYPLTVRLTEHETERYVALSRRIAMQAHTEDDLDNPTRTLELLLYERARLIASAQNKLPRLAEAVEPYRESSFNLFYCGDGRVEEQASEDEIRQIDAVTRLLGRDMKMSVGTYTFETSQGRRNEVIRQFENGEMQGLVAIRCLDEGVDIPATRRAFILASSRNPRQAVQRRGRVLRQARDKDYAEIFDFIVASGKYLSGEDDGVFQLERRLLRRELARVQQFARSARNGPQASAELLPLKEEFDLLDM